MGVWKQFLLFVLPLGLAAICKATIGTSILLGVLTYVTSILLGVLTYVKSGAVTSTPTGTPIKTHDPWQEG